MLPEGWKRCPLGDIAQITSGGTPDRSEPRYWGGNIPWVTTGEIRFNTITDTTEKITDAGVKNSAAKPFPPGTLLIAMYGQGKTRGQVAKLGLSAATNQACAAILLKAGNDTDFFYQALSSQYESLRKLGNAGTQKNLNGATIKQFTVCVPPPDEQKSIAQILATWDKAIAIAESVLANLLRQKRELLRRLLNRPRSGNQAHASWTYIDFDKVFERVVRKNAPGNTNVLTISGERGLISQREYFNKSVASDNLTGYTLLLRGEFAYNKSYSAGYPMGAVKPLTRYDAGVVSSLYICFRLRNDAEADPDFYRHYFEAGRLNDELTGIAQEGARNHGLLNVGVGDFFSLRLHVPEIDTQKHIGSVLNAAESEASLVATQIRKLHQEKRALMQQILTGKRRTRVPVSAKPPRV